MQRREFCKLITAATATTAISAKGEAAASGPSGFNHLHQIYEEFCATPENQRVFYALVDGKIVETKLSNSNWTPTAWGKPPELPGGSWDGVPMQAPIQGLNGEGPYQANWDSLLNYDAPEWYRDAKFGVWAHWSPQCVPEFGDWYARNMYQEGSPDYSYHRAHYGRLAEFGYKDLIDQHDPDLLYFDNDLPPLGWGGMNVAAYFYNHNLKKRGKMEAVLNIKDVPNKLAKAVVADYERGLTSGIMPYAWQSETCIGEWHYRRSLFEGPGAFGSYLPPRDAIHWLVDTVSKNGTFILNFPGKPDGTIDSKELAVLDEIAAWLKINGEAIFETRPWTVYGEGPNSVKSGPFQGASISAMGSNDIRFTRNKANNVIYAIFMGWPERRAKIESLGSASKSNPGKIQNVTVVGSDAQVKWTQEPDALHIEMPHGLPVANSYGGALKIALS